MEKNKDFYDELYERSLTRLMWTGAAVLVGILVCLLMSSCRTQYVPVPEYHYEHTHSTDTVHSRDTVVNNKETIIRETNASDSALLASLGIRLQEGQKAILVLQKELERIKSEKSEISHDTVIKVDSVSVPYPVEKKLGFWEKARYTSLGMVCTAVLAGIVGVALWLRRRYRGNIIRGK